MDKCFIVLLLFLFYLSCGPSAQEQQAMQEKAKNEIRDSIARVKFIADSINQLNRQRMDSVVREENRQQKIEDSLNTNANSQRWVYEKRNDYQQTIVATLKSVDDSLTIKVLNNGDICFYCDKIRLYQGFFRKKNSIQAKFNKSRALEYVVVESGIDCVKIRNTYTYVSDFKNYLKRSNDFEICFPTTDGWKNYQFNPEEVLNFSNVQ